MTTPAKKADHYLPAALIGLFGVPSTKPGQAALRYASVSVRFHAEPGQVKELRADAVAKRIGEYWIDNPPPGVPPNFVGGCPVVRGT